ncbi:MAG: leucine-rich repeat domain-containing protein [Ruminococcaceae bacterium]|nr:leucine-rich repeat domain-containing protein [Oscillospiraceae bacterium]
MKKLLIISVLILAVLCIFTACDTTADSEDVITVEDGYLVVNGVKTQYEVNKADIITIEDGYLVVNGVKTEYEVELTCDHEWQTVTTPPTCTEGGYDIKTCSICNKSVKTNATAATSHKFSTNYTIDNDYHWFSCTVCGDIKDKAPHTPDAEGICTGCHLPLPSTPGIVYDVSTDGTYVEVVAYNGTATKVNIPEEYNGLPVMTICKNAFYNNSTITSISLPDSVTSIDDNAFCGCSSLNSVVIPDSVTSIGERAFYNCSSLNSLVIGNGVTNIDNEAFSNCHSSLYTLYEHGKYVRSGDNPYAVLIKITLNNKSTYTIHENTTIIATYAFYFLTLDTITIPDSVTSISDRAFWYCPNLRYVTIPNSVTNIGNEAFRSCSGLSSVVIGNSVTSIGDYAFYDCSRLISIVISDSVTSIGEGAFNICDSLIDVCYTGSEEEWATISIGDFNSKLTSATKHYNYVPGQ